MKRTDRLTTFTALLLFLAMAAYIGFSLRGSYENRITTAEAVYVSLRDSYSATGLVVRDERVIETGMQYVDIVAAEGKRVAKDSVIATAMDSEAALDRATRIHELELEIERAENALSGLEKDDLTERDASVKSAVLTLSSAVSRGDVSDIDAAALTLRTLIMGSGEDALSEAELQRLKFELSGLKSTYSGDSTEILAGESGLFTTVVDGYEHISPGALARLTPDSLRELMDGGREASPSPVGKLVCGYNWYFAAVMDAEDAGSLKDDGTVSLEFGRYYDSPIRATVVSVGGERRGESVVVFSCSDALTDMLVVRNVAAEIIISETDGIRVPKAAVHVDNGTGETYVYTVTAMEAEKKPVEIVLETDDFYLVAHSREANALRVGNEIIVTGKNIFDGKVLK